MIYCMLYVTDQTALKFVLFLLLANLKLGGVLCHRSVECQDTHQQLWISETTEIKDKRFV